MKTTVIISGLLLILVANIMMVYYRPRRLEYFQNAPAENVAVNGNGTNVAANGNVAVNGNVAMNGNGTNAVNTANASTNEVATEGFASFYLENAGGAREKYQAIGAFDGVKLSTGNNVSGWRYTAPNEPLNGAEFKPGDDSLFMFKNNQCKPECCGASFSCGGGCVCTTPQQRQYIAGRGGNRNEPEDSL